CGINMLELKFENDFRLKMDELKKNFNASTKLISITTPHNPTGTMLSLNELKEIIQFAEANKCYILVDETYRDLTMGEKLPLAASLSDKAISISSVSKAYGIPGVRIGWLICRDKKLME